MQKKESVLRVIKETVRKHGVLSAALLLREIVEKNIERIY